MGMISKRQALILLCYKSLSVDQLLLKREDLPFWERIHLPVLEESSPFGRYKI